jgi:hypothetical protein
MDECGGPTLHRLQIVHAVQPFYPRLRQSQPNQSYNRANKCMKRTRAEDLWITANIYHGLVYAEDKAKREIMASYKAKDGARVCGLFRTADREGSSTYEARSSTSVYTLTDPFRRPPSFMLPEGKNAHPGIRVPLHLSRRKYVNLCARMGISFLAASYCRVTCGLFNVQFRTLYGIS